MAPTTVRPSGRIDSLTAPAFEQELTGILANGTSRIIVDLSNVTYMSSAGLHAIVLAAKQAEAIDGCVAICEIRPNIKQLFEACGLDQILPLHPDHATALASLQAR